MTTDTLPWIIAIGSVALLAAGVTLWTLRQRRSVPPALPREWALTARPVFSSDERRVYRQLREALPHHIVLSKLPLVRFCQPTDPQQVRYWYELLGSTHVGFAICSANGRVLAAIDIDHSERGSSRRALQIKQKVLAACRVRYLRCPVDHLPSVPELQLLVPHQMPAARAPQAATAPLSSPVAPGVRRRPQPMLWQDSGFLQDSFFGVDSRTGGLDSGPASDFGGFVRGPARREPPREGEAVAGVVVGAPPVRH